MLDRFNSWAGLCEHDQQEVNDAIAAITRDPWIGEPVGRYVPSQTYSYRCPRSGRLITYEVTCQHGQHDVRSISVQ